MEPDFPRLAERTPEDLLDEMIDIWHQGIAHQLASQPAVHAPLGKWGNNCRWSTWFRSGGSWPEKTSLL